MFWEGDKVEKVDGALGASAIVNSIHPSAWKGNSVSFACVEEKYYIHSEMAVLGCASAR